MASQGVQTPLQISPTPMKSVEPLTAHEISIALTSLPGWRHADGALLRDYEFPDFRDFISFVSRASVLADAADHHPEWTNVERKLHLRLTTREAGGRVTLRDISLARSLDRLLSV